MDWRLEGGILENFQSVLSSNTKVIPLIFLEE